MCLTVVPAEQGSRFSYSLWQGNMFLLVEQQSSMLASSCPPNAAFEIHFIHYEMSHSSSCQALNQIR